jgi:hypothetical protein
MLCKLVEARGMEDRFSLLGKADHGRSNEAFGGKASRVAE